MFKKIILLSFFAFLLVPITAWAESNIFTSDTNDRTYQACKGMLDFHSLSHDLWMKKCMDQGWPTDLYNTRICEVAQDSDFCANTYWPRKTGSMRYQLSQDARQDEQDLQATRNNPNQSGGACYALVTLDQKLEAKDFRKCLDENWEFDLDKLCENVPDARECENREVTGQPEQNLPADTSDISEQTTNPFANYSQQPGWKDKGTVNERYVTMLLDPSLPGHLDQIKQDCDYQIMANGLDPDEWKDRCVNENLPMQLLRMRPCKMNSSYSFCDDFWNLPENKKYIEKPEVVSKPETEEVDVTTGPSNTSSEPRFFDPTTSQNESTQSTFTLQPKTVDTSEPATLVLQSTLGPCEQALDDGNLKQKQMKKCKKAESSAKKLKKYCNKQKKRNKRAYCAPGFFD